MRRPDVLQYRDGPIRAKELLLGVLRSHSGGIAPFPHHNDLCLFSALIPCLP